MPARSGPHPETVQAKERLTKAVAALLPQSVSLEIKNSEAERRIDGDIDNIALEGRKVMLKVERLLANIAAAKNSK